MDERFDVEAFISGLAIREQLRGDRILVVRMERLTMTSNDPDAPPMIMVSEKDRQIPDMALVVLVGPGRTSSVSQQSVPVLSRVGDLITLGYYVGQVHEVRTARGWLEMTLLPDEQANMHIPLGGYELVCHEQGLDRRVVLHEKGRFCEICTASAPSSQERLAALQAVAGLEIPPL